MDEKLKELEAEIIQLKAIIKRQKEFIEELLESELDN